MEKLKGVPLVQQIVQHYTGVELPEDYVLSIFEKDKDYDIKMEAERGSLDDTFARDGLFEYLAQDIVGCNHWITNGELFTCAYSEFWIRWHDEVERRGWKHDEERMDILQKKKLLQTPNPLANGYFTNLPVADSYYVNLKLDKRAQENMVDHFVGLKRAEANIQEINVWHPDNHWEVQHEYRKL